MKNMVIALLGILALSESSFAGTKACEKLASDTALAKISKKVADDCFVRFIQPGKQDENLINVGIACDHTGSVIYSVATMPQSNGTCKILKISSKATDRNL